MTSAQRRLDRIAAEIRAHGGCGFEPCETAKNQVPGTGPADARVVLVGEAPGASEDRAGEPFVGRAGRFLETVLERAGLARDEVFITNVLKARPPGNRDPRRAEVAHSLPWLEAQLDVIRPELVVPLGRHALQALGCDAKVTDVRGTLVEAAGRRLLPLLHPAAALRVPALRTQLLADAEALGAALGGAGANRDRTVSRR